MSPAEKLELVDEDTPLFQASSSDWPEEEELLTPPLPADLPEERPGDPGSDFFPVQEDSADTDSDWAEISADIEASEFEDDDLLEHPE